MQKPPLLTPPPPSRRWPPRLVLRVLPRLLPPLAAGLLSAVASRCAWPRWLCRARRAVLCCRSAALAAGSLSAVASRCASAWLPAFLACALAVSPAALAACRLRLAVGCCCPLCLGCFPPPSVVWWRPWLPVVPCGRFRRPSLCSCAASRRRLAVCCCCPLCPWGCPSAPLPLGGALAWPLPLPLRSAVLRALRRFSPSAGCVLVLSAVPWGLPFGPAAFLGWGPLCFAPLPAVVLRRAVRRFAPSARWVLMLPAGPWGCPWASPHSTTPCARDSTLERRP